MARPIKKAELIEGEEAFERFQEAVKAVLKVKKADLPPSPFGKPAKKKTKSKNN
jgi:hypothetical protein